MGNPQGSPATDAESSGSREKGKLALYATRGIQRSSKMWALAKCARRRSHCAPESPKMPPLWQNPESDESETTAFSHAEKTEVLVRVLAVQCRCAASADTSVLDYHVPAVFSESFCCPSRNIYHLRSVIFGSGQLASWSVQLEAPTGERQ
jgi:hypothetical protein